MPDTKPNWTKLYATHFPDNTDGASRHVKTISEDSLRHKKSEVRKALISLGYDVDHWASSMETTVIALWEAKARIKELEAKAG